MNHYQVAYTGYASTTKAVTAESPQAAMAAAEPPYVSLCHQCSRDADIGDDWEPVEVIDLDTGEVVWTDDMEEDQ